MLLFFGCFGTGPAAAEPARTAPPLAYVLIALACLPVAAVARSATVDVGGDAGRDAALPGAGVPVRADSVRSGGGIFGVALGTPIRHAFARDAVALLGAAGLWSSASACWPAPATRPSSPAWRVWLVVPAAVGVAIKARRDAAAEVRAAQARRAVSEERLRLAQEVHDVAGHGFAVIAMQAGVALRVARP